MQCLAAKSNLKRVLLELRGKSPSIIFDDADLEKVATELAFSIGFISGQTCMASTRLYVQDATAEKFQNLLLQAITAQLKPGELPDPSTNHGPQANES
jgi:aldehyde dehydrogenase (NAD+)